MHKINYKKLKELQRFSSIRLRKIDTRMAYETLF